MNIEIILKITGATDDEVTAIIGKFIEILPADRVTIACPKPVDEKLAALYAVLNLEIDKCLIELPKMVQNLFHNNGLRYVGDLVNKTERRLREVCKPDLRNGLGLKGMQAIYEALLKLKEEQNLTELRLGMDVRGWQPL